LQGQRPSGRLAHATSQRPSLAPCRKGKAAVHFCLVVGAAMGAVIGVGSGDNVGGGGGGGDVVETVHHVPAHPVQRSWLDTHHPVVWQVPSQSSQQHMATPAVEGCGDDVGASVGLATGADGVGNTVEAAHHIPAHPVQLTSLDTHDPVVWHTPSQFPQQHLPTPATAEDGEDVGRNVGDTIGDEGVGAMVGAKAAGVGKDEGTSPQYFPLPAHLEGKRLRTSFVRTSRSFSANLPLPCTVGCV